MKGQVYHHAWCIQAEDSIEKSVSTSRIVAKLFLKMLTEQKSFRYSIKFKLQKNV